MITFISSKYHSFEILQLLSKTYSCLLHILVTMTHPLLSHSPTNATTFPLIYPPSKYDTSLTSSQVNIIQPSNTFNILLCKSLLRSICTAILSIVIQVPVWHIYLLWLYIKHFVFLCIFRYFFYCRCYVYSFLYRWYDYSHLNRFHWWSITVQNLQPWHLSTGMSDTAHTSPFLSNSWHNTSDTT